MCLDEWADDFVYDDSPLALYRACVPAQKRPESARSRIPSIGPGLIPALSSAVWINTTSAVGAGKLSRSTPPLLASAQWMGSSGRLPGGCGRAHRYGPSLRVLRRPAALSMIAMPAVVNTISVAAPRALVLSHPTLTMSFRRPVAAGCSVMPGAVSLRITPPARRCGVRPCPTATCTDGSGRPGASRRLRRGACSRARRPRSAARPAT